MATPRKMHEEQPFLSLMVTPRSSYAANPFRNRLTVALLELFVVPGILLIVGLLSVALWTAIVSTVA